MTLFFRPADLFVIQTKTSIIMLQRNRGNINTFIKQFIYLQGILTAEFTGFNRIIINEHSKFNRRFLKSQTENLH